MTKSHILECHNLSKSVAASEGELCILKNINLHINANDTLAIMGRSGSGKTTLLSLLAGLDTPSSGMIHLFGKPLHELDEDARAALRNKHIGFVFQAFHLLPGFTSLENVMLPLELNGRTDARARATNLLERVSMAHRLDHFPGTLSGGEQQRVALARAFATSPPLVLADEPTGNLDTDTGNQVIELLFELNRDRGTALILVTHDQVLSERCERHIYLEQGRIRQNQAP